jgi:RHS repeat-associated protein
MVLILGGTDANGNVVPTAEQFDPASGAFIALGDQGLIARTGHTATVLTSGQLLIAGGDDAYGHPSYEVELANPQCSPCAPERFNAKLDVARRNHIASMLPSADVLLWGGIGNMQAPNQTLVGGELANPESESITSVTPDAALQLAQNLVGTGVPAINFSQPPANAEYVPIDQPLVLRFSQRMAMATLNAVTVTLLGPGGVVAIKPIPVEFGVLLFVTPQQSMLPATRYTLFIDGATDQTGQALPFAAIGFTTAQLNGGQGNAATAVGDRAGDGGIISSAAVNTAINAATTSAPNPAAARKNAQSPLSTLEQQKITAAELGTDPAEWVPNENHLHGNWRTSRARSPLQDLPPLSAPAGVTALAGQVLTIDGRALANVTLSIGSQTAQTDVTGRFLLSGLATSSSRSLQTLNIDASTANQGKARYGYYQVLASVQTGQTAPLNYTIWMTPLDSTGNAAISSPTLQETVLTSPHIPGLELHLPAGSVIRGRDGKIVTQLNMTAIPVDRPPFPLPRLGVPVYFTIQPGGAVIQSTNGKVAQGARLFYPNFSHQAPGTSMSFWNYDAQAKGWYVYGQGTVSADGSKVIPNPGVAIYEFTGAMVALPTNAPPEGPPDDSCKKGDPVDCATGLFLNEATDLVVVDAMPIVIGRSYRPQDNISRAFGIGTNLSYDFFIVGTSHGTSTTGGTYTYMDLILPNGTHIHYPRTTTGTSYADAKYKNYTAPGKFFGSVIDGGDNPWKLTLTDGTWYTFADSDPTLTGLGNAGSREAAVRTIHDRFGNSLTLTRDASSNLTKIVSSNGRYVNLTYDTSNRIVQVADNLGRVVSYAYDAGGRLWTVTDPSGNIETYTYDSNNYMLSVKDKRGNMKVVNTYDANGRISKQTYADGSTNNFSYTVSNTANIQGQLAVCMGQPTTLTGSYGQAYPVSCTIGPDGMVTQTNVTDGRGNVTSINFNGSSLPVSITTAQGLPEQQTTTIQRDPNTNLITSRTDALGRQTAYTYDIVGNMLTDTKLAGTVNSVTTTLTYYNGVDWVASITDPLHHTVTLFDDAHGNTTSVTDSLGNVTAIAYNSAGQPTLITDPLGHTTTLNYSSADLAAVADSNGNTFTYFTDGIGRRIAAIDPIGNVTHYSYNSLSRLTGIIDPRGGATTFSYDPNGNLLSATDANGGVTAYAYDTRNRVMSRNDQLLAMESYIYDSNGNLASFTDRKGQVSSFSYDGLNRRISAGFGATPSAPTNFSNTITYTFDGGDRLTQLVDSVAGTITRGYDGLDRLTSETTPQGSVGYTYDNAGRRTSMTVAGQPPVAYAYDNVNRLTGITEGASNISFSYDNASRRSTLTLANGIVVSYGYDSANRLTGITYTQGGNSLGNLTYSYDAAGRRTGIGGSYAQAQLPATVGATAYNAANQLTTRGGNTFSYDRNGNLTGDGNTNYTWNSRNQLTSLGAAATASFQYDGMGRRIMKTVTGTTTGYMYDGINAVQELSGTSPSANLLTGLAIDETFMRTDAGGNRHFLSDALGSTLALTDDSGTTQTGYNYEPYGTTTTSGAASNNSITYSGRENDNTGLYYYRARYYSPTLQRFISEDPIGLAGGINTYAYVEGDPLTHIDPLGLASGTIALFAGVGGQITFGQNPNGSGFLTVQFGWGIGGGASFDLLGQQPGYDPSQGNDWGVSTGLYAQAKFRGGPISADIGPSFGRSFYFGDMCSQAYGNLGKPKISAKDSWAALKVTVSAGGQITLFGGGVNK